MWYVIIFIAGLAVGVGVTLFLTRLQRKVVETTFASLSRDALQQNAQMFLSMANETLSKQSQVGAGELDTKKKLIDQTLEAIKGDLQKVEKSTTEVNAQLKMATDVTSKLQDTTSKLQSALANTKVRGQWGERMAEDILQLVGFAENVNYTKQKTLESSRTRPDYTFLLPQDLKVNMDVKFPLDNYLNYLNAATDADRDGFRQKFVTDARQKMKEVKSRDYINPAENTVDYALMFIPNEQVFCFLQENDSAIMNDSLKERVILCSPMTLFALLCVMREAVHNFNVEKTAGDILRLLENFDKQWGLFKDGMDKMGQKIQDVSREYDKLSTTRTNQLERPLRKIEDLKRQQGLPPGTQVTLPGKEEEEH